MRRTSLRPGFILLRFAVAAIIFSAAVRHTRLEARHCAPSQDRTRLAAPATKRLGLRSGWTGSATKLKESRRPAGFKWADHEGMPDATWQPTTMAVRGAVSTAEA